ncbi:uncharacterized protein Tco025E_07107 [Trypanosoma conorhini]|uniref:Uncharacterized protein n=1 Tax=Trypanosoma conorhini TaxID=83891 RepID=A0A3R7KS89_9TRYP|nr:uncharacterized protein Tco025E_07107 [Trypanosoma conorhini]RNF08664.1 hypothetical protein Tco025E_07107 [Trypanosoma conorhini]
MYAAHHRVAPLRRGGAAAERHCATTPCDSFATTPMGTQADIHTQRSTQLRRGAASCNAAAAAGVYSLPATLRRSWLAPPPTTEPSRGSQMSMHAAPTPTTSAAPLTQLQVGDAASLQATLSQTSQHHKEAASALLALVQSMQQQEKHLAASSQSLSHIPALVDTQQAQVTALHGLTAEVRAMAAAIRDAASILQEVQSVGAPPTPRRHSVHKQPRLQKSAAASSARFGLVLGADSPSMTPCTWEVEEEAAGVADKGEAAYACQSQRPQFMLRGTAGCAAASEFVEDDVFSM